MNYDPLRDRLGRFFNRAPFFRKIFFKLLDAIILRNKHVIRELHIWANVNPAPKHILDAGSGFGSFTYVIHKINPNYSLLGIDTNSGQVADGNEFVRRMELKNVFFRNMDLRTLDCPSAFDFILCVSVLEYIDDVDDILRRFSKALKPGGNLLIYVPSDHYTQDQIEENSKLFGTSNKLHSFNLMKLKVAMRNAGFPKVRARYTYGKPGAMSWLISQYFPVKAVSVWSGFVYIMPLYYLLVAPVCMALNYFDTHMGHTEGKGILMKGYK